MVETQRIALEDANLAVDLAGDGPAVLFIHGFPFDRSMWLEQITSLRGIRAIAPDLRGLGSSVAADPDEGFSMELYARDLLGLLDALAVPEVVVCGLSMGGYIAFECLRRWPQRIRGLILIDTKAEADDAAARDGRTAGMDAVRKGGTSAITEAMLPRLLSPVTLKTEPATVDRVRSMMNAAPAHGVIGALQAMLDRPDSTPLLSSIRQPALVLVGQDDQLTPPEQAEAMCRHLPRGECRVIPNAGHLLPLEQPGPTNEVIHGFIDGLKLGS